MHDSDCATHSEPAERAGDCTCPRRECCFIGCAATAEWELWPSTAVYESTDACTAHVGNLLDDAPETRVIPIAEVAKNAA